MNKIETGMKSRLIAGMATLAVGLLFILVPLYLFPVCEKTLITTGNVVVPMKCFWTARMAAGLGAVIAVLGLLTCLSRSAGVRLGMAVSSLLLGLLAIAIPGFLIGVCMNEAMPCHMGTLPALYLLAAILLILSLASILHLRGKMKNTGEI